MHLRKLTAPIAYEERAVRQRLFRALTKHLSNRWYPSLCSFGNAGLSTQEKAVRERFKMRVHESSANGSRPMFATPPYARPDIKSDLFPSERILSVAIQLRPIRILQSTSMVDPTATVGW